jgi:hypothetical protein
VYCEFSNDPTLEFHGVYVCVFVLKSWNHVLRKNIIAERVVPASGVYRGMYRLNVV